MTVGLHPQTLTGDFNVRFYSVAECVSMNICYACVTVSLLIHPKEEFCVNINMHNSLHSMVRCMSDMREK